MALHGLGKITIHGGGFAEGLERFDAVRSMEMQEARDDYMFVSLHKDPEFVELTRLADGHTMK